MSLSGSHTPEDSMYGSWVELDGLEAEGSRRESLTGPQDSAATGLQGELQTILQEALLECERSKESPPSAATPRFSSSPPTATPRSSSSPPAATPRSSSSPPAATPRSSPSTRPSSEHDSSSTDCITIQEEGERPPSTDWVCDWSSRLEYLPPKEFVFQDPKQPDSLSLRRSEVMKKGLFSSDVLLILVPALLASHLLTLGVGVYIGKRLAASTANTL